MIRQLIPLCFESLKQNGVLARILTVSHPIIERSASAFLTPSLLLLVVGVSDAFVRDWSGKENWIFLSSGSRNGHLI